MTGPSSFACPDPIAERRYAYAQAAAAEGDFAVAAEVLEQTLERAPDWPPAWFALGEAREKLGRRAEAAEAFRAALKADPDDAQGAGPRLARLENRALAALPPAYVARLFDDYAPRFERHLREQLDYRGPELILDALPLGRRFGRALDLGCGSGLMGRALRDRVARLEGVDLSPAMIETARATGGYDALSVTDLAAFLAAQPPASADLVVAADTLVYLGDLRPICAGVSAVLSPGGLFVFTVESGEAPFALADTLRFRHSDAHIREAAALAGLEVAQLTAASTRREARKAAEGRVVTLRKG